MMETIFTVIITILYFVGFIWFGKFLGLIVGAILFFIVIFKIENPIIRDVVLCTAPAITIIVFLIRVAISIREAIIKKRKQRELERQSEAEKQKNNDLLTAVNNGDVQTSKQLIENGADIYLTSDNKSLIEIAVENHDKEMVSFLIKNEVKVGQNEPVRKIASKNWYKPALKIAVEKRDKEIAMLLLEAGAIFDLDDLNGLLIISVEKRDKEIAMLLLEAGAVFDLDYSLIIAVKNNDKEMVSLLIDSGADVNFHNFFNTLKSADAYLDYPLTIAVKNNDKEIVSLLIDKGADVNSVCGEKSVLDYAEDKEVARLLKSCGAKTKLKLDKEAKEAKEKAVEEAKRKAEKSAKDAKKKAEEAQKKIEEHKVKNIHNSNYNHLGYKEVKIPIRCVSCSGTGFHQVINVFGELERRFCPDCYGTGYLNGTGGLSSERMLQARCISCGGTGFRQCTNMWGEVEQRSCVDCRGTGYMIPGWGT